MASVLSLSPLLGTRAGVAAMVGDLGASFLKRRLSIAPSAPAPGLDQIPEALLPLLVLRTDLDLTLADVMVAMAVFVLGQMGLSTLLYRAGLRDTPF